LGQNPDIHTTPTSGLFEMVSSCRTLFSNGIEWKAQNNEEIEKGFKSFLKNGIYGYYEAITDKPYVVDKSRGWGMEYDFINAFDPNPKIICMIRDPRSVYASMEKNYRKNSTKDPGIVNHIKMQNTTTFKRVETWVSTPPVGLAFERIQQMLLDGTASNILFVKFEDLTKAPDAEMRRIYNFLQIPYYQHDFDNVEQITTEDDEVYGIYGDHNIRQRVEPVPNTYKEILGTQTSNFIKSKYDWFFQEFKYI
jgi:sulfotransferase